MPELPLSGEAIEQINVGSWPNSDDHVRETMPAQFRCFAASTHFRRLRETFHTKASYNSAGKKRAHFFHADLAYAVAYVVTYAVVYLADVGRWINISEN